METNDRMFIITNELFEGKEEKNVMSYLNHLSGLLQQMNDQFSHLNLSFQAKQDQNDLERKLGLTLQEKQWVKKLNLLFVIGFSTILFLLFQIIRIVKKRNKILADKNAEIASLNEKLETKVKERTIEVVEKSASLNNYYENLPGVAYRLDCDKLCTPIFMSKGSVELFKMKPKLMVSNSEMYSSFLVSDDYREILNKRKQFVEKGNKEKILDLIYSIRVEGKIKWIRDRCKLQIDKKNNRFLDGILLDISDEKTATAALKNSQHQLATIYNSSRDFIGLIRKTAPQNYVIESFNEPAINFLLEQKMIRTSDELIGRKIEEIFKNVFGLSEELLALRMQKLQEVFTEHKIYRHLDPLAPFGEKIPLSFETIISPIFNEKGECTHALYSARNITESEMAKNKLILSEKRLSSIFNGAYDRMAIFDITEEGEILFEDANQSFRDGWKAVNPNLVLDSIYGKSIKYYLENVHNFSESEIKERLDNCNKIIEDKKPYNYEESFFGGSKQKYFLDVTISPILNKENVCSKLLFILRDITLKHRAKEQMISKILEMEDRERSRFAKELHDGLGQNLTAASLSFNHIKKEIKSSNFGITSKLESGLSFLNEAIQESRNIAHNLMPKSISDFGYILTVESLLENLNATSEIDFSFYNNLNGERLPPDHELHIYRITQEAINNILKHAQATKVMVQLIRHENSVILTIEDNGKGFDWHQNKDSFGLDSMLNRASALSAVLDIDGAPEKGTSITLEIPTSKRIMSRH